ncbi:hypothetical protein OG259_08375 [Streptomyces sp. NBC_00250]|uniref:hypothetical protein n=1 Tax=Streptomyces sp. NBC_00250 TaxID=2903641 RepID=UPI002E2A1812|nr:hypothetical protein [Streptomyces sp. NBC_00250]
MATRMIPLLPGARRSHLTGRVPEPRRSPEPRTDARGASGIAHPRELGATRLAVPVGLHAGLGCDAVGVPARFGFKILSRLPAKGCVYADSDWWWWLVPAGSDHDVTWPLPACYARGAEIPDRLPRLIHHPDGTSPYTPPIPLYLLVCQLTGIAPSWAAPPVRSAL